MNFQSVNLRQYCFVVFLLVSTVLSFSSSAQIIGVNNICVAAPTSYTIATPGGYWSMTNPARAYIDPYGGVVTAISPGLDTIIYNYYGVITIKPILIHPIPQPISGLSSVCSGASITLSDATSGGTWSSSNPSIAPVGAGSGIVAGVSSGSTVISYTLTTTGCYVTAPVYVYPYPSQFIGCDNAGVGDSLSFYGVHPTDVLTTDPSVAIFDPVSLKVIGVAPGTTPVSIIDGYSGCPTVQRIVTITPAAMIYPITGTNILCAGNTAMQSDSISGGVWTSSDPTIASVSTSGLVTSVSGGLAIITYSVGGYTCNEPFAVNSLPLPITGPTAVCASNTIALYSGAGSYNYGTSIDYSVWDYSNPTFIGSTSYYGGGYFTSSDSSIANIVISYWPATGYINGLASGAAVITYTNSYTSCAVTYPFTVNDNPLPITGLDYFHCIGGGTTLYSDATPGGTWTSSNTFIATIGSTSGILTTGYPGTIDITYTLPDGCLTSRTVTNILPVTPVTGANPICPGANDTLSWFPGCTWTSSNPAIATIGAATGYLTGVSSGVAVINATMGTGCNIARYVTINPVPGAIGGSSVVCAGDVVSLSSLTAGTWYSLDTTVATADALSGIVSGVSPGVAPIVFTNGFGCTTTKMVTVDLTPVTGPLTGPDMVCQGSFITLSDTVTGGIFSSSLPGVTTVSGTGVVSGIAAGVATISYSVSSICATAIATQVVTVNALPVSGSLTGPSTVCPGATITLSGFDTGGVWSLSNVHATGSAEHITGASAGTDTVYYSVTNICGTSVSSKIVTINPLPVVAPITGASTVCLGASITLSDAIPGGSWSSTSYASVSGGTTTGVYAGTAIISYTSVTPCGTVAATKTITINPLPYAGVITGSAYVCRGSSVVLIDSTTGGVWSSSNGNATVSGGTISGITTGLDTIGYSVSSSCGTANTIQVISVNPLPVQYNVTGGGSYCAGGAGVDITLSTSQIWTSYMVYRDSVSTGVSLDGTGAALDFGPFTTGKYTIVATGSTTGCVNGMTGFDTVYIAPPVVPAVTITAHPGTYIGVGSYDTLTANITGGGTSPTYQWSLNGSDIYGATSSVYYSNTFFYGDSVKCFVTSSAQCGTSSTGSIVITTYSSGVKNVGTTNDIQLFPNPNKGTFTFNCSAGTNDEIQIVINNLTGEKVMELSTTTNRLTNIKLDAPPGIYFLTAISSAGKSVMKVSVE